MRSPIAPHVPMQTMELEGGLTVLGCPATGGVWIRPSAYWRWREQQSETSPPATDEVMPGEDSRAGKRCPEDGHFLTRRRVGNGVEFHVERCTHCGGFWLDRGEWDTLRRYGLAKQLHHVFSAAWQARVREQEMRALSQQRLEEALGSEDARRVETFTDWLASHPMRTRILARLAQAAE